jgi:putative ABC transport system ATP-binding protein
MNLIKVRNLEKTYESKNLKTRVLKGLSFDIDQGEFVSLVGPSGSGKTTLLHVLGGFESYQGSVELFNKELTSYHTKEKTKLRAHDLGFVFQFYNLIPNLNVYENVLIASIFGKQKSKKEILDILEIVGMKTEINKFPAQLSGGMQQRVAIARALINEPKILFADEPTGNLDSKTGKQVMELFKKLNISQQLTIVMVTHNEETTVYGTRTIHMIDGKVIKDEKHN